MTRRIKQKKKGSCLIVILRFFLICLLIGIYPFAWIPAIPGLIFFVLRKRTNNRGRKILISIVVLITSFVMMLFVPFDELSDTEQKITTETSNVESETAITEYITEKKKETEVVTEAIAEPKTEVQMVTEVVTEAELAAELSEYNLTMDVIDVGQGLSLLFESNGEYMLYDGGDRDYSSKVVAYLKQKEVQTLDYVIASHYDSDHLNGVVGALNVFDVETVIAPDYTTDTRVYESFTEILPEKGIELTYPKVGNTYELGNSTFTILAPTGTDYADVNDYSVAIRVECNENSFIVTGDATSLSETEMISNGQVLDSDVMVVGHHGSDGSTSQEFLAAVSPEIAVISCGLDNEYLHPSQRVMELLQNNNITVYRTDKQGEVVITSDGTGITCSAEASNDYSYGVETLVAEQTMYSIDNVNIRAAMSTDSEILGSLAIGDKVEVISEEGDWAKILYNGATAYVAARFLSDSQPVQEVQNTGGSGDGSNFNTYDNEEQQQTAASYVLNTSSRKIHYPSCHSVKKIAPHNYATSNSSRDSLIAQGYSPCGNCHP